MSIFDFDVREQLDRALIAAGFQKATTIAEAVYAASPTCLSVDVLSSGGGLRYSMVDEVGADDYIVADILVPYTPAQQVQVYRGLCEQLGGTVDCSYEGRPDCWRYAGDAFGYDRIQARLRGDTPIKYIGKGEDLALFQIAS